jgi:hypothetical protein
VLPDQQGFVEEAYFTFSHSPIYDERGAVGGIFVTALETTATVLQQRRLALLSHLNSQTALSAQPAEAAQHLIAALATNKGDIPFALLYEHEAPAARVVWPARWGTDRPRHAACPPGGGHWLAPSRHAPQRPAAAGRRPAGSV